AEPGRDGAVSPQAGGTVHSHNGVGVGHHAAAPVMATHNNLLVNRDQVVASQSTGECRIPGPAVVMTSSGTKLRGEVRSRKRTASAMSSAGIITAPEGSCAQDAPGVSTNPGSSAVTWIPSRLSSACAEWLRATNAALVAASTERLDRRYRATSDLTLLPLPSPRLLTTPVRL